MTKYEDNIHYKVVIISFVLKEQKMNKTLKILAIASVFAILLVSCSKKSTKANNNKDSAVSKLEAQSNSAAKKKNSQNKLFDIPESPVSDFSYELSDDNSGVKITAYKGGANCRIPAEIEGMPVTEIADWAFASKDNLIVLVMPDTIKTVGENCFYACESLSAVKLSSSLSAIGKSMFHTCESLEEIDIPASVTTIEDSGFHKTALKSIYIPDTVIEIQNHAFSSCKNLSNVRLPSTLKILPLCCFSNCTSLESIDLPNGITKIGNSAFSNCESLSSLKIPETVTKIEDEAFEKCKSLTSLTIPNSVTSIGRKAFDSSGLKTLEIADSVTNLECTFSECKSLEKLHLPDSLEVITYDMVRGCKSLQSVNIPASTKKIASQAFYQLGNLTELIIPDSLTKIEFALSGGEEAMYHFQGTNLNLAAQKRLKDLGYTGKFSSK